MRGHFLSFWETKIFHLIIYILVYKHSKLSLLYGTMHLRILFYLENSADCKGASWKDPNTVKIQRNILKKHLQFDIEMHISIF